MSFIVDQITRQHFSPRQLQSLDNHMIDLKQAKVLFDDYHTNHSSGPVSTKCVFVSLDSLRSYLTFIDIMKTQTGVNPSGVRIYFGSHPSGSAHGSAGRETVFITPTINDAENKSFIITNNGGRLAWVKIESVLGNLPVQGEVNSILDESQAVPPPGVSATFD